MEANVGKVSQVIGAVVDVEFEERLPEILNAIKIEQPADEAKAGALRWPRSRPPRPGARPDAGSSLAPWREQGQDYCHGPDGRPRPGHEGR